MKVVCAHNKISEAVEQSERIITRNLTLPILNNLLIEAKKNELKVSATNLEIGISIKFPCKVAKEGEVSIPAKILRGIIANLTEEKIELETKKENTLSVKAGTYTGELKGQNARDFPIIPSLREKSAFRIPSEELSAALAQVIPFTAISETRPEITGILFSKKKGQETMNLVSTDSFRLAEKTIYLKKEYRGSSFSFIIPQKTASEVLRLVAGSDETEVTIERNQVSFKLPQKELVSRVIEGNYPNYEGFVPKDFVTDIVVDREELIKAVRLVSLLSSRINDIRLTIKNSKPKLAISARDVDLGENETSLPVEQNGDDLEISFNWHYLVEGLQHTQGKKVTIKFTSETKPALIRSAEDTSYVYIVMPIRV